MKKYAVILAMLLAACGEKGNKVEENVANVDTADEVVAATDDSFIKLAKKDSGSKIEAEVGAVVEVVLEGNVTTGYNWEFISYVSSDDAVEELMTKYIPDENPDGKVGVGGKSIYRIKLLKPGDLVVVANYLRASEEKKPEDGRSDDFVVSIKVK